MKLPKLLLLSLLGLVMIACSSEEKDMSKFDFSDPELIPEGIKEWIQVKSNIQLSLPDSIIMGKVLQVEFSDSEIFLLESGMNASILVFGRDGTFKRRLFKSGNALL